MARTHLSTIQRRNQTAAIEVWEEEDGSIVQYIDGNPVVTANTNLTGVMEEQAAGIVITTHPGDIRRFGAKCDGQVVYDAVITSLGGGLYRVVSATASFSASDVGKVSASVASGTGKRSGYDHTVSAFTDANTITIACSNASVVTALARFVWGTDDTAAMLAAVAAASATSGSIGNVFVPNGITCVTAKITLPAGVDLIGMGNLTTIMFYYQIRYAGSVIALCKYLATGPVIELGSSITNSEGKNASNARHITVDAQTLAQYAIKNFGMGNHDRNVTALGGNYITMNVTASGVMDACTITGPEHQRAISISGDARVSNNYIFGSGAGYPAVTITGADVYFEGNHIWKDSDVAPSGALVACELYDGTDHSGAITITGTQFDTAVGANVKITISANTTIRCINIVANHSINNDKADNTPSAVINGTITGGTTLTVNSVTSGKVYLGARISGGGTSGTGHVLSQVSGTLGGAGVYTLSAASANVGPVAINLLGYPYIELDIAAGSTLRMLNIVNNTGYGSYGVATKCDFTSFVDATAVVGSLLCTNVTSNVIDNCRLGYGAAGTGFAKFVPTNSSGNYVLPKSTDTVPVAF